MGYHPISHEIRTVDRAGRLAARLLENESMRYALIDAVLRALPAHVVLLDSQGTIVAVNEAWRRFVRESSNAELTTPSLGISYLETCRRVFRLSHEDAEAITVGLQMVLEGRSPSFTMQYLCGWLNTPCWFMLQITPLPAGPRGALVSHVDISEAKQAEEDRAQILAQRPIMLAEVGRRRAEAEAMRAQASAMAASSALALERANYTPLRALQALSDGALSLLTTKELLSELLLRVMAVMSVDNAAILLLDEDGQTLTLQAARGPEEDQVGKTKIPVGTGFAGHIAATKAPLLVDNLGAFQVANPRLRERLRSLVGVPLLVEGRLVGVLHIGSATTRHFTEQDVQFIRLAADRIALAVDRARLYAAEQDARTQAETALAYATASEVAAVERVEQLHAILETITDAVIVTDQIGRIIQANRAYHELFGTDRVPGFAAMSLDERIRLVQMRDAVTNQPLSPDMYPVARALRGEVMQGPTTDIRVRSLDGRELELSASAAALRDHDDHIAGAVCVFRDIAWRRNLEREREEVRANELALQETTERLDEFIATAAHDLRSPLTVAMGATALATARFERLQSEVLSRDEHLVDKMETFARSLEEINRSVDRLSRMVSVLFDTAQAHAGRLELHPAPCDLAALIREHIDALRTGFADRTIQLELPRDRPLYVVADGDRIGQVVTNYVTNALKYSAVDMSVEVRVATAGNRVRVAVRDHGLGVPPGEQKRIWRRFYRVQGVHVRSGPSAGLGLGLHICRTIIERHGGQVGVKSTMGVGSTFWFTLPLAHGIPHLTARRSDIHDAGERRVSGIASSNTNAS